MHIPPFLTQALIYLIAAVIAVPLFKRLGLGSVLGYLVAGIAIGPFGLKLIPDVESVLQVSELGVVLLLFLVGLELNPERLWAMRRSIFGLGGLQVMLTILLSTLLVKLFGVTWNVALVVGMATSMSSTAIALQILNERSMMKTAAGESAFSVALFQDLAVVPLMLILGLLAPKTADGPLFNWTKIGTAIALIVGMVIVAKVLLKPLLRYIAKTRMREIFIACALLLIVGSATLTASVGLSLAMGSFLAGVLLADSEYRMELEVDIDPFKGLLLGLFFIAVGMSINIGLISKQPLLIAGLALAAVALKFAVLRSLGLMFKLCRADGWIFAIVISQIGEFAFVLTSVAQTEKVLQSAEADLINAVVAVSMLTTPLLMLLYKYLIEPSLNTANKIPDEVFEERNAIIIAGVGRFGQMVGRVLQAKGNDVTLIDVDPNQLELLQRFGWKTHYGDARRPDVLEAAGIHQAKLLILAMDDPQAILETAQYVKEHFPAVNMIARARGRIQAYELIPLDVLVVREVFAASMKAAELALIAAGVAHAEASQNVLDFVTHDERLMIENAANRGDQAKLVASAARSREELSKLLAGDSQTRGATTATASTTAATTTPALNTKVQPAL